MSFLYKERVKFFLEGTVPKVVKQDDIINVVYEGQFSKVNQLTRRETPIETLRVSVHAEEDGDWLGDVNVTRRSPNTPDERLGPEDIPISDFQSWTMRGENRHTTRGRLYTVAETAAAGTSLVSGLVATASDRPGLSVLIAAGGAAAAVGADIRRRIHGRKKETFGRLNRLAYQVANAFGIRTPEGQASAKRRVR